MKTKHAAEIRKGITFANKLYEAMYITHDTALQHYWLAWQHTWLHEASKLAQRAYLHRIVRLEVREYRKAVNQLHLRPFQKLP